MTSQNEMKTGNLIPISHNFSGVSLIGPIINTSCKTLDLWIEILIYKGSFWIFFIHTYSIVVWANVIVVLCVALLKLRTMKKDY